MKIIQRDNLVKKFEMPADFAFMLSSRWRASAGLGYSSTNSQHGLAGRHSQQT